MSGDGSEDPGPIWEHLPGFEPGEPADGRVVDAAGVSDRVLVGMADDDNGRLPPPGAFAAYRRGVRIVFGQPRKLAAVVVLLAMLLVPVLPLVSVAVGAYLSTLVVLVLVPVTYVRRDDATLRVSLTWLFGIAVLCAVFSVPWIGTAAGFFIVPAFAFGAAAWMTGSWRDSARAVGPLFRRTWFETLVTTFLGSCALLVLFAVPALIAWGLRDIPDIVLNVVGTVSVFVITACAIGYAAVAIEEARESRSWGASTDLPT